MDDEQLERIRELIGMHRQFGHALSIQGEADLLAEVDRLRAILAHAQKVLFEDAAMDHGHRLKRLREALDDRDPCKGEFCIGWKDSGTCPQGVWHR